MPKCILTEQGGKGGGSGQTVTLASIAITTPPTVTRYVSGENFNPDGMVVEATYKIGNAPIATTEITGYSISPTVMTDGVTEVTITYSESGTVCTATQAVTVIPGVVSIEVTTNPTKVTYEYGDALATAGMVVTAHYSDGTDAPVTGYTCTPTTFTTLGSQNVTVSYTEDSITRTTTFAVTVERKSVAKPTWKDNLVYNGNVQTVNSATYWNNFDTTYMTVSGTTSGTNAATYVATFTPRSNYRWADGTTTALNINWYIDKAPGTLTLSSNTAAITGSNYSTGVNITITRSGDGEISYSPTAVTGLTITLTGTTLNIKGDGSTAASATITVSVEEGTNYTAPASQDIAASAVYWEWGDEAATGDADWWTGLKNWAASATADERAACVGKKKLTSLSTAVLGANAATMICIGADQDGTGTLTFQTQGTLPTTTVFGSAATWIGSTARTQCQNFYNYCSAKNAIKTVSKGTCPNQVSGRNGTATYNDETVWLPSEREMGLDSYSSMSTANSTTTNAECTYGYNAAYSYYTSNTARIKYAMAANGTITTTAAYYWERSRFYGNATGVCFVYATGAAGGNHYNNGYSLAPAFVIGEN